MKADVFKLTLSYGFLNSLKKKYIIMIITDPFKDNNTHKLIVYKIINQGVYITNLQIIDALTAVY